MKVPAELHEIKKFSPLQVIVTGSLEGAIRQWKSMVQKEKVISLYKEKSHYEKASDKKRRKKREAKERTRLANLRQAQIASGEWERIQKKREQKKKDKRRRRSSSRED